MTNPLLVRTINVLIAFAILALAACDSTPEPAELAQGAFRVEVTGDLETAFEGVVESSISSWDGVGVLGPSTSTLCASEDRDCDWGDEFSPFFSLLLSPAGSSNDDKSFEGVQIMLSGVPEVGSFDLSAPNLFSSRKTDRSFGTYVNINDSEIEFVASRSGTLTIDSYSDGMISGRFAFESNRCLCLDVGGIADLSEGLDLSGILNSLRTRDIAVEGTFSGIDIASFETIRDRFDER